MLRSVKSILLAAIVATVCIMFGGMAPGAEKTLRVGQYENPPTIFRNARSVASGFWPELTASILDNIGYDLEYVDCLWSQCLRMLEAGEIDLMPDIALTPARAERFQFVDIPLLYDWSTIVAGSNVVFEQLKDFEGKRIAVLANSIQEAGIDTYLRNAGLSARLVWTSTMADALEAVAVGDADIAIVNRHIVTTEIMDSTATYVAPVPFNTYSLHFAASPTLSPGLVDAINLEIYRQQTTFRSTFQYAFLRWARLVPLPLAPWVSATFLLSAVLLIFAGVATLAMRRIVWRRTRELTVTVAKLEEQIAQCERAEAFARETQKMDALGRLVGGVAHDFNNLLAVIMGNLELIKFGSNGKLTNTQYIDEALTATKRGATLTADLLSFGRRARLDPAVVDTSQILSSMRGMLERTFPATIDIRLEAGQGVPPVRLDRVQLENALLNLALNARDAMPEGGTLTISCTAIERADGPRVRIRVADTGEGMSDEVRAKVFEPFFTTKDVGKGSGMGLAMVYGFANQSFGDVTIHSAPGAGTTVDLMFPATRASVSKTAVAGTFEPTTSWRILLVEDNDTVRSVLANLLESLGHEAIEMSDGRAALDALIKGLSVHAVISDVVMPGEIQGTDLAKKLRKTNPNLPILLITGYSENIIDGRDVPQGTMTLNKPVSRDDLSVALAKILGSEEPDDRGDCQIVGRM